MLPLGDLDRQTTDDAPSSQRISIRITLVCEIEAAKD